MTAPTELVPDLAATIGKWKEERERLKAEIEKARQDCDPTWEEVLKKRRQFFEEFKGHLLRVAGPVREIFNGGCFHCGRIP